MNSFEIIGGLYKRFKISPFDSSGRWQSQVKWWYEQAIKNNIDRIKLYN